MTAAADAVVEAVSGCGAPVLIVGDGPLADEVRARLGVAGDVGNRPAAVVELTGTAEGLRRAFAEVADLGTVVLAGPLPSEPVTLDLHDDLHVRGLTLVGLEVSP